MLNHPANRGGWRGLCSVVHGWTSRGWYRLAQNCLGVPGRLSMERAKGWTICGIISMLGRTGLGRGEVKGRRVLRYGSRLGLHKKNLREKTCMLVRLSQQTYLVSRVQRVANRIEGVEASGSEALKGKS